MSRTPKQTLHDRAMRLACFCLKSHGHRFHVMPENNCPFDLLVDGYLRCEVKAAESIQRYPTRPAGHWQFSMHRHRKLLSQQADVYWLHIDGVAGFPLGVDLVVPHSAVKGRKNVRITKRTLWTRWFQWYLRMDLFADGQ